jgi:hypothetical protein
MKRLSSSLLGCALLLYAEFQARDSRYRRPLGATGAGTLTVFNVDRATYLHSQPGLADLRVVRGQAEVPYVIERMSGRQERTEVASGTLNQTVNAAGDLEVTVDVGSGKRHNGVRLSTSKSNFRQRVAVATSDDGRDWALARDDGYIFDFQQDGRHVSVLEVSYPVSARRYVRLTVYGWNDPKAVAQCWVMLDESTPPVRDVMATLAARPQPEPRTQSTLYTWDLDEQGIPHDELALDVETPAFQRSAVVETSRDGKDWTWLGQDVLSRFHGEQPAALHFPERGDRYLRLRIENRDDQPLAVRGATLSVIRTRVKFRSDGGSYWLYYGNPDAHAPSYDLGELLAREAPVPETVATLGPEERNPDYREKPAPAKPWTEQHPEILYATLAVAVIAMGAVTVRFLRQVAASPPATPSSDRAKRPGEPE